MSRISHPVGWETGRDSERITCIWPLDRREDEAEDDAEEHVKRG